MANAKGNPQNLKPFQPGNGSGNPGGKPVGAKNAISAEFLKQLGKDFNEHGAEVIAAVREADPGKYMAIVAALVPRDDTMTVDANVSVTDERDQIKRDIKSLIASAAKPGNGKDVVH